MFDQLHQGLQTGAMKTVSGSSSSMSCMAKAWPFLEFKLKPVFRSIGGPTFSPVEAQAALSLAEPEKSSRKSIFSSARYFPQDIRILKISAHLFFTLRSSGW